MTKVDDIRSEELSSFVARIERLEEEMSNVRAEIREVYASAKSAGYDPKIMRVVLRLKKLDEADRVQLDEMTEKYRIALNV